MPEPASFKRQAPRVCLHLIVLSALLSLPSCSVFSKGDFPRGNKTRNTSSVQSAAALEGDTLRGINRFRRSQGLPPVTQHPGLTAIARQHSAKMARTRKMSHRGFDDRYALARNRHGIDYLVENVQYSYGTELTGEGLTRLWAGSKGHRQNMLKPYRYVGIGINKEGTLIYSTMLIGE